MIKNKYCKCGCGEIVKNSEKNYTQGHNPNSQQFKKKNFNRNSKKRLKTMIKKFGYKENGKLNFGYKSGKHPSPKTEFKKGHIPWTTDKTKKDYPQMTNKSKLGQKTSQEEINKMLKSRKKYFEKHGYKSKENSRAILSVEIKLWRLAVFERDYFTCKHCQKRGCYLEAHHIKSWAKYPKLRFNVSNGETLCEDCHKKTKNYKGKNNKK